MKQVFEQHLQTNFPGLLQSKILVAVSGGLDSVVLTHLCYSLKLNFALAHCNFRLRQKESETDEYFVKNLAKKLDVTCYTKTFETSKYAKERNQSTQVAARNLRYNWFEELLGENDYKYVLTGHHLDDNLETFLINFTRGTGISGLTGIPEKKGQILRPLLPFSRKQIEKYAQSQFLEWRTDSSNSSDVYLRNRIRHHIIPVLKAENPSLLKSFQKTQDHLKQAEELNADYSKLLWNEITNQKNADEYHLSIEKIRDQSHPKAILYQLLKDFGFTQWQDIYNLLQAQSGKEIFSKTHRLIKDREVLILTQQNSQNNQAIKIYKNDRKILFPDGQLFLESVTQVTKKKDKIAYIAAEKIRFPLLLRKLKTGDRFQPFGMKGSKKISDFLIDKKFSLLEKEKTWILESQGEIIWVVGHRIDERFKVENSDPEILKISLEL
jgi:tRNA(Ile)-lysidine synthase